MEFRKASHVDVVDHERTPAEESLYASYLLRKQSDVGNLYSSNVYEEQCFEKTIKQIDKDKRLQKAEIDREMKILEKRLDRLKTRSTNGRLLKARSETLGCVKDLNSSAKEGLSTLPYLSPGDKPRGKSPHLLCRAMSEVSLINTKNEGQVQRSGISFSKPLISITVWNSNTDCVQNADNNIYKDNEEVVNIANVTKQDDYPVVVGRKKSEKFFVTDVKGYENMSTRISRRPKRLVADAPRQRSLSPCRLTPVDALQMELTKSYSFPQLNTIQVSKSHDDITDKNDVNLSRLHRRPRAHTISGQVAASQKSEDAVVRDDSGVGGPSSLVLPKI